MTVNLSLILKKTRIQKQFPLSGFVFIDSLAASALQEAGGYAISHQNNLELHLGCHTCWLSYFTLVCLWCGRTDGRAYGHVITKFSLIGRLPHFHTYSALLGALRARELPYESLGKINLSLRSFETGNLSADNFKNTRPRRVDTWARGTVRWYWSADTLFWQLSIDHNIGQN